MNDGVALRYCGDITIAIRAAPDKEFTCHLRAGERESAEVFLYAPDRPDAELETPETFDLVARMAIRTVNVVLTINEEEPFGRIREDDKGDPVIARQEDEAWGPT